MQVKFASGTFLHCLAALDLRNLVLPDWLVVRPLDDRADDPLATVVPAGGSTWNLSVEPENRANRWAPLRGRRHGDGSLNLADSEQREVLIAVADAAINATRRRWCMVADYSGVDESVRSVEEVLARTWEWCGTSPPLM